MRINKKILIIGIIFIMCLLYAKIVLAGRSFLSIDLEEYDEYTGSELYNNKDEELIKSITNPSPSIDSMNLEQLDEYIQKAERLQKKVTDDDILRQIANQKTKAGQRRDSYFDKSFRYIEKEDYENYSKYKTINQNSLRKSILEPEPSINNMTEAELEEYIQKARILKAKVNDESIERAIDSKITQAGRTEGKKEEVKEPESVTGNSSLGLPSLDETYRPQVEEGKTIDMVVTLLNFLTVLGLIAIVISIALMGLGAILGSASQKAEYQHKFIGIVVAAGIIASGSAIAKMIISVAESL